MTLRSARQRLPGPATAPSGAATPQPARGESAGPTATPAASGRAGAGHWRGDGAHCRLPGRRVPGRMAPGAAPDPGSRCRSDRRDSGCPDRQRLRQGQRPRSRHQPSPQNSHAGAPAAARHGIRPTKMRRTVRPSTGSGQPAAMTRPAGERTTGPDDPSGGSGHRAGRTDQRWPRHPGRPRRRVGRDGRAVALRGRPDGKSRGGRKGRGSRAGGRGRRRDLMLAATREATARAGRSTGDPDRRVKTSKTRRRLSPGAGGGLAGGPGRGVQPLQAPSASGGNRREGPSRRTRGHAKDDRTGTRRNRGGRTGRRPIPVTNARRRDRTCCGHESRFRQDEPGHHAGERGRGPEGREGFFHATAMRRQRLIRLRKHATRWRSAERRSMVPAPARPRSRVTCAGAAG